MSQNRADINSPDVIKDFRNHFVKFDETCRQAITGIQGDTRRVVQWLRHDQLSYWTQELRKRQEDLLQAKIAYSQARDSSNVYGKTSCVDEQRELRKAEHRKDEAEQKLKAVKKWIMSLEPEIENLIGPVNNLSSTLSVATPRALAQLGFLIEKLEEYMRLSAPDSGTV
jgi:hypothetical protein